MAGGGSSSSKPVDMTPGAFKNLQGPFAGVLQSLMGLSGGDPQQSLSGIPTYQGNTQSQIGGNEQSILDQLMQFTGAGQQGGPSQQAQDYLSSVLQGNFMGGSATPEGLTGFAQMLSGAQQQPGYSSSEMNPFLNASIEAAQRPTLQALEETLSRTLPGRFTEAGQFKQPGGSSAFDRAAAIATRGASDSLADIATNLSYATYEAERNRAFEAQEGARTREFEALTSELDRIFSGQQAERGRMNEAAALTSQLQQTEVDNLVKNLQAQALPRLIEEYGIERGLEQFNNQVNTLLATLGISAGVTQPTVGQSSQSRQKPNLIPLITG